MDALQPYCSRDGTVRYAADTGRIRCTSPRIHREFIGLCENVLTRAYPCALREGKPAARRGREARGVSGLEVAGLPNSSGGATMLRLHRGGVGRWNKEEQDAVEEEEVFVVFVCGHDVRCHDAIRARALAQTSEGSASASATASPSVTATDSSTAAATISAASSVPPSATASAGVSSSAMASGTALAETGGPSYVTAVAWVAALGLLLSGLAVFKFVLRRGTA